MSYISRAIVGGLLGGVGKAAWNATEGNPIEQGVMKYALGGAAAGIGSKLARPENFKSAWSTAKDIGKVGMGYARSGMETTKGWGRVGMDLAEDARWAASDLYTAAKWNLRPGSSSKFSQAINKIGKTAGSGGIYMNSMGYGAAGGALAGGLYGSFSNDDTMFSGAFKGALAGLAVGAAAGHGINKRFNFAPIKSANNIYGGSILDKADKLADIHGPMIRRTVKKAKKIRDKLRI